MCYYVDCDGVTLKATELRMWYIMKNFKAINAC